MDATWAGGENISFAVDFHAVGHARFTLCPRGRVEEDLAVLDGAVGFDIEYHPYGVRRVGVGDVEFFFIRRKGGAVGRFDVFGQTSGVVMWCICMDVL